MSYAMLPKIYPIDPGAGAGRFQPRDEPDNTVVQVEIVGSLDDDGCIETLIVGAGWGQASCTDPRCWEGQVEHVWVGQGEERRDLLPALSPSVVKELAEIVAYRACRECPRD